MRLWTRKKDRRYFLRLDVELPAVFCVLGAEDKPLTELQEAKVINLTHEGCCLALSFLRLGGFHLHRCLEEPEKFPLLLNMHPSKGVAWHLTSQVRWINRDLDQPGGEFRVGVVFESGQELPREWRRKAMGT